MKTFSLVLNIILTLIIVIFGVFIIIDYMKTKKEETISPSDLKDLRKSHFIMAMLIFAWLLIKHIERFFD